MTTIKGHGIWRTGTKAIIASVSAVAALAIMGSAVFFSSDTVSANEIEDDTVTFIVEDTLFPIPDGYEGRSDATAYMNELAQTRKDAETIAKSYIEGLDGYVSDSDKALVEEARNGIANAWTFAVIDEWKNKLADMQKQIKSKKEIAEEEAASSGSHSRDTDFVPNVSGERDPLLAVVTWSSNTDYLNEMARAASYIGSSTDYFITCDWDRCRVTILERNGNTWKVIRCVNVNLCANAYYGVWAIADKQICFGDDSLFSGDIEHPGNDWASCYIESYTATDEAPPTRYVEGKGYEDCAQIHSIEQDNTGYDSHGCIRMRGVDAKWVWDNIPIGTTLYYF